MNEAKYTPGPWSVDKTTMGIDIVNKDWRIACLHDLKTPEGVLLANARLIAAAPDLLAVAQMLVADYAKATCGEDMNPPIAEACAAIAKAIGTAL